MKEYGRSTGELHSHGKTEELGEKAVPVPLCPPQIPFGLLWGRTGSLTLFDNKRNTTATTTTTTTNNNNSLVALQLFNFGHYIQHPIFWTNSVYTDRQTLVPSVSSTSLVLLCFLSQPSPSSYSWLATLICHICSPNREQPTQPSAKRLQQHQNKFPPP